MNKLFLISGPSGVGKTTLCEAFLKVHPKVRRVITATSRPMRKDEKEGRDYHFLDEANFRARIKEDHFYEWAEVYGNLYGVPRSELESQMKQGDDLLLNIDVQGANTFQAEFQNGARSEQLLSVFIMPASLKQIRERLQERGEDSGSDFLRRVCRAQGEIIYAEYYDHCFESKDKAHDLKCLCEIYELAQTQN